MEILQNIQDAIYSQLKNNQFLTGGVILGSLTGLLYQLKSVPNRIWISIRRRILFTCTIDQTDELYVYLQRWLGDKYKKEVRSVMASYVEPTTIGGSANPVRESGKIQFYQSGDAFVIWYNNRLISISNTKEKVQGVTNASSIFFSSFSVSGLGAKDAIIKLLDEVVAYGDSFRKVDPLRVYSLKEWGEWEYDDLAIRDIDSVFIDKNKKSLLINDIKEFCSQSDFYRKRQIPYRRGYLLHGPPGTGKSSLVGAVCSAFRKNLYKFNLKSLGGDGPFEKAISLVKPNSIVLIEDFDSYFDGRTEKTKISFSTFINSISGVNCKEDVILFITTNKRESLDAAITRSGRIDFEFELSYPSKETIEEYLEFFYHEPCSVSVTGDDISMADIENICVQNKFNKDAAVNAINELKSSSQLKVA